MPTHDAVKVPQLSGDLAMNYVSKQVVVSFCNICAMIQEIVTFHFDKIQFCYKFALIYFVSMT